MFLHTQFLSNEETGVPMQVVNTGLPSGITSVSVDGTYAAAPDVSGNVKIYIRSGNTYTLQATLVSSDYVSGDAFGYVAKISGDGNYVVIGAVACTVSGVSSAGAVYIFKRSGTVWTQQTKLVETVPITNGAFGFAVDIDNTGSHVTTSSSANVYVFGRTGTSWSQEYVGVNVIANSQTLHINGDGDYFAYPSSNVTIDVYNRTGSVWTHHTTLTTVQADQHALAFNKVGDVLGVVTIRGGYYNYIYQFTRSASTWSQHVIGTNRTSVINLGALISDSGDLLLVPYANGIGIDMYYKSASDANWVFVGTYTYNSHLAAAALQGDGKQGVFRYSAGNITTTLTSTYGMV